jgi:beta-lactamase class A
MQCRSCAVHWGRRCLLALCLCVSAVSAAAAPPWQERLTTALERIDATPEGPRIGVYVRALASGESASFRAGQSWYLASTVKVPVAIAVLRGIARGDYQLDTPVTLRADDYVDGAGATNRHAVGVALPIRFLLEQMVIHSDNTASDMLIGWWGRRR